jgi:hypothetical protein
VIELGENQPMNPTPSSAAARLAPARLGFACLGWLIALTGCHFYQFGSQGLYRPDIQTVYVEMFEADTFRKFLGQRLTEAVIKDVELHTPLCISEPDLAHSVLRGRLVRERKRVVTETINDDPRDLQIDYMLEVTWTDRSGAPLMDRQVLRLSRNIEFIPEGGQSLTTAEQELINRLARQIVQQMEASW